MFVSNHLMMEGIMYSDTILDRSNPINYSGNEFIVYEPINSMFFSKYIQYKREICSVINENNIHYDDIFIYPYPNLSSDVVEYYEFLEKIDKYALDTCIFINISGFLKCDNLGTLQFLDILNGYIEKHKEKVFILIAKTDNLELAKRLYIHFSFRQGFRWIVLEHLLSGIKRMDCFSDEFRESLKKSFATVCQKITDRNLKINSKSKEELRIMSPSPDFYTDFPKIDTINMNICNNQELENFFLGSGHFHAFPNNKKDRTIFKSLEAAFSGNFFEAFIILTNDKLVTANEKIAAAFFLRYICDTENWFGNTIEKMELPLFDLSFLEKNPIALMLTILEEINLHNYTKAISLLKLMTYTGWQQVSFVWNSLLWNSTLKNPEAALVCIFSYYEGVRYYKPYDDMIEVAHSYFGRLENNISIDNLTFNSYVVDYLQNCTKENKEKYNYSLIDLETILSGFAGDVYFFSLFSDIVYKGNSHIDDFDVNCMINVRKARDIFSIICKHNS